MTHSGKDWSKLGGIRTHEATHPEGGEKKESSGDHCRDLNLKKTGVERRRAVASIGGVSQEGD